MLDENFDNDDNPYLEFKLHRYTNMPQDLKINELQLILYSHSMVPGGLELMS